jgi:hypothetical protein
LLLRRSWWSSLYGCNLWTRRRESVSRSRC